MNAQAATSQVWSAVTHAGNELSAQLTALGDHIDIGENLSFIADLIVKVCDKTGVECGGTAKDNTVTLARVELPMLRLGGPPPRD